MKVKHATDVREWQVSDVVRAIVGAGIIGFGIWVWWLSETGQLRHTPAGAEPPASTTAR